MICQPVTDEVQGQAALYWNRAGANEHGSIHKENLMGEQIPQEQQKATAPCPDPVPATSCPGRHSLSSSSCQIGKPLQEYLSQILQLE